MTDGTVPALVLVFALAWAAQMAAGGGRARRLVRTVRAVRLRGRTAIGRRGSRTRGVALVALAVGHDDGVVAATGSPAAPCSPRTPPDRRHQR